ncbi:hypothetical protein [Archangium violaceum]|uniref:hypothetical protein n=1 Tax=Archangium violaceum TaxID=83451 RepID=UPI0036DBAA5D
MSATSLMLSGLGLITSVGYSVEGSCAAIRCGITRPHSIDGMNVWDPEAEREVPLVGHPIAGLTDGFQGIGRWFRLGRYALLDLLRYAHLDLDDASFWRPCGLIACLPEPNPDRFAFPSEQAQALPLRLMRALGLPLLASSVACIEAGPPGPLMALRLARQRIAEGTWQRAIILAVDSLVDESSLRWLKEARRLKTPERPTGLMPGEAGACFLVEPPRHAGERGEALVGDCTLARPPHTELPAIRHGQVLSGAIHDALAGGTRVGDILGNHNGEEARAMAWGTTRLSLPPGALEAHHAETWPAVSLGDVGAASTAVSICVAARAFTRRYARNDATLVWCLADDGTAGACVVRRNPARS